MTGRHRKKNHPEAQPKRGGIFSRTSNGAISQTGVHTPAFIHQNDSALSIEKSTSSLSSLNEAIVYTGGKMYYPPEPVDKTSIVSFYPQDPSGMLFPQGGLDQSAGIYYAPDQFVGVTDYSKNQAVGGVAIEPLDTGFAAHVFQDSYQGYFSDSGGFADANTPVLYTTEVVRPAVIATICPAAISVVQPAISSVHTSGDYMVRNEVSLAGMTGLPAAVSSVNTGGEFFDRPEMSLLAGLTTKTPEKSDVMLTINTSSLMPINSPIFNLPFDDFNATNQNIPMENFNIQPMTQKSDDPLSFSSKSIVGINATFALQICELFEVCDCITYF
jgi:hypothetical protein